MNIEVVDTHFHLWWLDKFNYVWPTANEKKIFRNFLPSDYQNEMISTPIKHSVFVEVHENIEETEWILQQADQFPFIKGVVGYVDLTSNDLSSQLAHFKKHPKFVGVRKVLDASEEGWIERDDVIKAMNELAKNDLTYDLLIRTWDQYESAKKFLKRIPSSLKVIIDHLGKPNAKTGAEPEWYEDIKILAGYPNVYCKLSGMVTEADFENWKTSDFMQHVEHVIKHFGIDRVMFGSDWPVCKLANANLPEVYQLLSGLLKDLNEHDKRKVFADNAVKFYNLKL